MSSVHDELRKLRAQLVYSYTSGVKYHEQLDPIIASAAEQEKELAAAKDAIGDIVAGDMETNEEAFKRYLEWSRKFHAMKKELAALKEQCVRADEGWKIATDFIANMKDQHDAEIERVKAAARLPYEQIFKWLLGENGEFQARPEGAGAYWWRIELRQRLTAAAKETPCV